MSCSIITNPQGERVGVKEVNSEKSSQVFQKILGNPHIKNFDQALDAYQTIYKDGVPKQEPILAFENEAGESFLTFAEALKATSLGDIQMTLDGKNAAKISTNSDVNTQEGAVNFLIKEDILSDSSYKEDGKMHLLPKGETFAKKKINGEITKDALKKQLGFGSAKINIDNSITISEEGKRDNVTILNKEGEEVTVNIEELNKPFKELKRKYDEFAVATALASNKVEEEFKKKSVTKPLEIVPENEMQEKLIRLLQKFGIKTLTFEQYFEGYGKRNQVPPNATALADLGEKLIAFRDGEVREGDLIEEVSHLIEASIPMEDKANILRNIHKTKEWTEFSEAYRDIYPTDEALRREILGKVIANGIMENFQGRENQTENTILSRIKEWVDNFIEGIRNYFQEDFRTELNNLNQIIFRDLVNESLDLNISEVNSIFFNANHSSPNIDKIVKELKISLELIKSQERLLGKSQQGSTSKVYLKSAERLLNKSSELEQSLGIAQFAKLISSQTNQLVDAINEKKDGEFPLNAEENVVYQGLQKRVRPVLSTVKQLLDIKKTEQKKILEELNKVNSNLEEIEDAVRRKTPETVERWGREIAERHEMSDAEALEYKTILEASLNGSIKDTDFMHTHIGSLLSAQNPLLNMAGMIIKRMTNQSVRDFQKEFKGMTNVLQSLNWTNKDWAKIVDEKTFSLRNDVDQKKLEDLDKLQRTEIIDNLLQTASTEVRALNITYETNFEDLLKTIKDTQLTEQVELFADTYTQEWGDVRARRKESKQSDASIEEREKFTINIAGNPPQITKDATKRSKEYSMQKARISAKAGVFRTKSDNVNLRNISQQLAEEENPRQADGEYYPGVKEVFDSNLNKYVVILDNLSGLSVEQIQKAQTVVGLNHIKYKNQAYFEKKGKERGMSNVFMEALLALPTHEQLEFLENNAYISFPEEYYNQFGLNSDIIARLRKEGQEDLVEKIRAQQAIIKGLKRENAVIGRPAETDFASMNKVDQNQVKLAQEQLEKLYSEAQKILPEAEFEGISNSEVLPNKAYFDYIEESGEDRLTFINRHVTSKGQDAIATARRYVESGGTDRITKSMERYFTEGMSEQEMGDALIKFAESKLLPYLKKSEPSGYTEVFNQVLDGTISVEDWIKRTDLVKISPNSAFYEDITDINPRWLANRDAKREQWTQEFLAKVQDTEFLKIKQDPRLLQGYNAILEYYDTQIENNNLTGRQSRYLIPGVRATKTQRFQNVSVGGVKEIFNDMLQFRPEEKELGNDLQVIPVYYNTPLEKKEEQTTDYLYAMAMYGQAATLHKHRRASISDMYILEDAMNNVSHQSKNAYKMFKNFMDYNYYGKKEEFSFKVAGGRIDLGKVLQTLNGWAKTSNLASIFIPITSATTATAQKVMERIIGEVIDPVSANRGNSMFKKYANGSVKETMALNSTSPLNVIGEALGLYSITGRYENSQLNKAGRLAVNINSKVHEIGNFPVIPPAMFGVIASYRYVDGKIMHYSQFAKKMKVEGFKGDLQTEWKTKRNFDEDFIGAVQEGVLDFTSPEFLKIMEQRIADGELKLPPGKILNEYIEDKVSDISTRALSLINRLDAQIPNDEKSIMARDGRFTFFLSHLNWLLAAIPRKLKNRHYNESEEMWQEGSWRTVSNFLTDVISSPKNYRETYNNLDFGQKKNLKRMMVELAFTNALVLVSLLLSNYVDDDDDPNLAVAFTDLLTARLAVETLSGTTAIPSQVLQLTEEPIMLKRKIEGWAKVTDLGGDSSKVNRYIGGVVPFYKDAIKFQDLKGTRQSYMYFQNEKPGIFENYAWLGNLASREDGE